MGRGTQGRTLVAAEDVDGGVERREEARVAAVGELHAAAQEAVERAAGGGVLLLWGKGYEAERARGRRRGKTGPRRLGLGARWGGGTAEGRQVAPDATRRSQTPQSGRARRRRLLSGSLPPNTAPTEAR